MIQPPPPPPPPKKSGEALRLLTLLQRKGRLLDFLLEDIQGATNEQIGAGVRELHREAQAVLKEHLTLEPVLPQSEGDTVVAPPGFDPSAIRLTGNVTGQPPFRGVLKHHGWRVKDFTLSPPPEGQDELRGGAGRGGTTVEALTECLVSPTRQRENEPKPALARRANQRSGF